MKVYFSYVVTDTRITPQTLHFIFSQGKQTFCKMFSLLEQTKCIMLRDIGPLVLPMTLAGIIEINIETSLGIVGTYEQTSNRNCCSGRIIGIVMKLKRADLVKKTT